MKGFTVVVNRVAYDIGSLTRKQRNVTEMTEKGVLMQLLKSVVFVLALSLSSISASTDWQRSKEA